MHDLHDRKDSLEKIKAHYKDEPYEVIILEYHECMNNPDFVKALELSKIREQEFEKAGAKIIFSDDKGHEETVTIP